MTPQPEERGRSRVGGDPRAAPEEPSRRAARLPHRVAVAETPPVVAAIIEHGAGAWPPFLCEYSRFMLGCIRRVSSDHDERMDIYLHVCARLHADDCRRLRTFRGGTEERPCKFTTWLATVTMNLAREWIRQARGRKRMYRTIEQLPGWQRRAFEFHYWEGYSVAETTQLLGARHGARRTEGEVAVALGQMRERLGGGPMWCLVSRRRAESSPVRRQGVPKLPAQEPDEIASVALPLEDIASTVDAVTTLRGALLTLSDIERECLELRFRDDLTAKQIADMLGIRKYKQVYEVQARALTRLRAALIERGWTASDFAHMHRIGG